jgi:hypothetical protein
VLVAANGTVSTGRDEFLVRHEAWFASGSWRLDAHPIHTWESDGVAIAVVHLRHRDPTPHRPLDDTSILTLVFARAGHRWLLVHHQNTTILA